MTAKILYGTLGLMDVLDDLNTETEQTPISDRTFVTREMEYHLLKFRITMKSSNYSDQNDETKNTENVLVKSDEKPMLLEIINFKVPCVVLISFTFDDPEY